MSRNPFLRTAAVFLLAGACYAATAQAATPAAPVTPAVPSTCATPDFLLAPPLGATEAQVVTGAPVCACGDTVCNGLAPFSTCGSSVRVCVAVGSCPAVGGGDANPAKKICACVTKDPP